jgi:hypothetical protein
MFHILSAFYIELTRHAASKPGRLPQCEFRTRLPRSLVSPCLRRQVEGPNTSALLCRPQIAIGASIDAVDRIPFISSFLEFVGLAVVGVYGYRYFTDPDERCAREFGRGWLGAVILTPWRRFGFVMCTTFSKSSTCPA